MTSSSQRKGGAVQQLSFIVTLFFLTFHVLKNVEWLSALSEKQRRTQQAAELMTIAPPFSSLPSSSSWSIISSSSTNNVEDTLSTNTTMSKVNVEAQPPVAWSAPQIPPTSQLPSHGGKLKQGHVKAMATTDNINKSATRASLPLCTRQQLQTGEWSRLTLDKPPYVSRYKHLRCYPDEVYNTTPWTHSWDWQPRDNKSCTFAAWNATEFCFLMQHVTISIIGDSLSWEQYSSLLQLLGQKVRQTDQHRSKSENRNHIQTACGESGGSNNKTSTSSTTLIFRNDPRLEHISESIHDNFPLVLILNRGAHYVNDSTLLTGIRRNVQEIQTWQESCRKANLHCHLFWRTTVPGHPLCVNYHNDHGNETTPFNDMTVMEERVQNLKNYDNATIDYHWYDFQHQNKLILQELAPFSSETTTTTRRNVALQEETTTLSSNSSSSSSLSTTTAFLSYQVIDAYHLNMLRPDEHRVHTNDCLHNCYPGKMDVLNQLLLHFLKMDRTLQDVQRLERLFQMVQAKRQEKE
jgi:hypothetical protein